MKIFRLITTITPVAVLAMLLIFVTPAQGDQPALDNLLLNPGFEAGDYQYYGDEAKRIPEGWEPFWDSAYDSPRYNPSEGVAERIHGGIRAASYWEQYRDFDGGLFQRVAASPGTTYRLTAYGQAVSESNVKMEVGISKNGGFDHNSGSIVWSGAQNAKDTYSEFSVEATAEGAEITVFLRGSPDYPVEQTDFYWDDVSLVVVSTAAPTAKPEENKPEEQQPQPSGVTVGSIPKSTPAPDGSVVHTVQSGETLIGIAVTYSVTLEELRANNNLTTDMVFVGQQLVIALPGSPGAAEQPAAEEQPAEEPAEEPPVEEQPAPETAPEVAEATGPGTVCVMSYEDGNANGIRDGGEIPLAGITFAVSDSTQIVAQYTTDGVSEPYCFTELTPGTYIVSWTGDQYTATTEQTWATSVAAGATVSREFGAQSSGEAADDTGKKSDREGLPVWATALIGAIGVVFFLSGVGAAVYFLVIRRSVKI